ncbi:dnaJ homolog subfamily C member 3 [Orussus abietinus]|uniref:dnaJ homolog subfamily C member 3 n=1 Tax=Orussus abietinus TaxID=222816 RepID=UPI0006263B06|nr:dnaJ homolog subfamily C member 3 [Orussus abietinus]
MYRCGLLLVLLDFSFNVAVSISQPEIDRHLELGREYLARGQFQDALSQYHAALEGDPNDYLTYYKRSTIYLALGKSKMALLDLDKVLELKSDFMVARLQRGNILLKQAEFEAAKIDLLDSLAVDPNNEDALNTLYTIEPLQMDVESAEMLVHRQDYLAAVQLLNKIIEACPWAPYLRELRAESHAALGQHQNAVSDIRLTTKLLVDNTEGFYKLASMLYNLGEVKESLKEIRECLKLDPEHKECFPFYKKIKKVAKCLEDAEIAEELKQHEDCIDAAQRILKAEPHMLMVRLPALQYLCKCYAANGKTTEAIGSCQDALNIRHDPETLCNAAEAYLSGDMFDDAIREFKRALDVDPDFHRAKEGLQKAQQRQKISETRDYYKILDVPRTASKRDIIKAYRKAAQRWHPDNFQEGDEKKRAQKKFIDIAAAKEVLTDEEKRAKFDRGEDPLDPESGKHPHGFNPFQEFHQFHGSPFQFKFHFN